MTQVPYTLRVLAGETETRYGERLYHSGAVHIVEKSAKRLSCKVADGEMYDVVFTDDGESRCSCPIYEEAGACRHVVAAMLKCQDEGAMGDMVRRKAEAAGPKLMAAMDRALPEEGTIHMEVRLTLEPVRDQITPRIRICLLIGEDRLYVVKSIPQMIDAIDTQTPVEYGKGFVFHPEWMRFGTVQERILKILRALCLAQKEAGALLRGAEQRDLALPEPFAEEILRELMNTPFRLKVGEKTVAVKPVRARKIPLQFRVSSDLHGLTVVAMFPKEFRPLLPSCSFALVGENVVAVEEQQRGVLRVLYQEQLGGQCSFDYPVREAAERKVLDALGAAGFIVSKGHVYLTGQEAIFNFVSEGLQHLQELAEVYLSNDFKRMTPRKPKFAGKMRLNGSALELKFTQDDEPAQEILAIMEALARRRRYFRLKDGSFLDLSAMDEWLPLADSIFEAAQAEGAESVAMGDDTIRLQAYRACYLQSLLESLGLPIEVDEKTQETVRLLTDPGKVQDVKLPDGLSLRPYQERGFQWLLALDRLHMGGVLADDMGLGKTVQVIALLMATRQEGQVSLVVAPTTLTYNWLSELGRFAPDLSVMVLGGSAAQRASQIRHVKEAHDVDVLITSYPLIRQDIEQLTTIEFRFAILDEAQHIKNAGSKGAQAVRQLQAQTRFALTGTPLENGVGELWSIFNFVLPGYLLSYSAFLRRYQDGTDAEDLRRRISPFLMRRLKKEVLTELPDKIESVFTAQMSPEQAKVYEATMMRLRQRVDSIVKEKGFERGRTEVLAAITQLREICCHPSLVLDDYTGTSGKLDMLLDMLPEAIAKGRRVLLFSAFTSMLKILRRELDDAGYETMYLDGDTPAQRRVEMAEQFNAGQGQIFLISLKAGGTGLNLTGADMVIHYDPWWNPAAEDQATDRAYRIGQTRKVEVIRLVTHASIEEQVVALGQRKKALFDQLIKPGESMVGGLSPQEIMSLFQ